MARKSIVNNNAGLLLNKAQLIENKILFLGKKYLIDISVAELSIQVRDLFLCDGAENNLNFYIFQIDY